MDRRTVFGGALVAGVGCCGLLPARAMGRRVAADPSLLLTAPAVVVSDRTMQLGCRLIAAQPVGGVRVVLERWSPGRGWSPCAAAVTDALGRVSFRVRVWRTAALRAVSTGSPTGAAALPATTSAPLTLRARPSGSVIDPSGPEPRRRLPPAPPALGAGAHPGIHPLPERVWESMQGLSWRPGAPVGRSGLRYLTVNYWGFDGYWYRGEMVLNTATVAAAAGAFAELYSLRFPIRQMVLPDRFGAMSVSPHLGADDYRSMAADNTSGFNYRYVDGTEHSTRTLSPHAYGNAIDLNTWENPYGESDGPSPDRYWPDRYWADRARRSPATFGTASAPATRALTSRGFAWGAGYDDWQHFQLTDIRAVPGDEREAPYG